MGERADGQVQITVLGKGHKPRSSLLPPRLSAELLAARGEADGAAPLFVSREGRPLSRPQVDRLVAAIARRAGIDGRVSPHWLRHAHASYAVERGAPRPLLRDTLGHANLAITRRYTHTRPGDSTAHDVAD